MDWLLAAAGWDAGPDPLLHQHLTDFVPVMFLIPNQRGRRWQILQHPIASAPGATFAVADPMEFAGQCPLGAANQGGSDPPC